MSQRAAIVATSAKSPGKVLKKSRVLETSPEVEASQQAGGDRGDCGASPGKALLGDFNNAAKDTDADGAHGVPKVRFEKPHRLEEQLGSGVISKICNEHWRPTILFPCWFHQYVSHNLHGDFAVD
jgi:hypothetical protein